MRLTAQDLRELNILKYYRLTRKWVCKTYGLKDADTDKVYNKAIDDMIKDKDR
jgi:hypothetical protein